MVEQKRIEEDKVVQAPIAVILGGKKYEIAPLVIKYSRKWRAEVVNALASLPSYAKVSTENPELFKEALNAMLVSMQDNVIELFFSYARDLPRDEIESIATEIEIAKAFEQVVEIAFPLANSLVRTMGRLSQ